MSHIESFEQITFPHYTNQVLAERGRSALNDFHRTPMSMRENRNPEIFYPVVMKYLTAFVARDAEANGADPHTFLIEERQVRFLDRNRVERLANVKLLNKFEAASALSFFCEREEAIAKAKLEEMLERKRQKGIAKAKQK